jgi:hypothetical protein
MTITAKYKSACRRCGGLIKPGAKIEWDRAAGSTCARCLAGPAESTETAPYHLGGGSGYGCVGWAIGATIRIDATKPGRAGWPEYVTVVRAGQQRVREDGMSFGVGDDSGTLYSAECRAATEAEAAECRGRIEARDAAKNAIVELVALHATLFASGEITPQTGCWPTGREVNCDSRIYSSIGAQSTIRLAADAIWVLRSNGGDGDDWSANNIPGGIARKTATTPELTAQIEALATAAGRWIGSR